MSFLPVIPGYFQAKLCRQTYNGIVLGARTGKTVVIFPRRVKIKRGQPVIEISVSFYKLFSDILTPDPSQIQIPLKHG
jgi:hypothetical protein